MAAGSIVTIPSERLTARCVMDSMQRSMKSWASVSRLMLAPMSSVKFGLMVRRMGTMPSRILLRMYFVERFEESSRKGMPCAVA